MVVRQLGVGKDNVAIFYFILFLLYVVIFNSSRAIVAALKAGA